MKIKFKKLKDRAQIPSYAKDGDAGIDLVSTTKTSTGKFVEYGTDLSIEIPKGYAGFIFPRSSISKTGHTLRNSVGVIDSGYRGEIKLRMSIPVEGAKGYSAGDKVGQLILIKTPLMEIEEVDKLSPTERGDGGFGSTGE